MPPLSLRKWVQVGWEEEWEVAKVRDAARVARVGEVRVGGKMVRTVSAEVREWGAKTDKTALVSIRADPAVAGAEWDAAVVDQGEVVVAAGWDVAVAEVKAGWVAVVAEEDLVEAAWAAAD